MSGPCPSCGLVTPVKRTRRPFTPEDVQFCRTMANVVRTKRRVVDGPAGKPNSWDELADRIEMEVEKPHTQTHGGLT